MRTLARSTVAALAIAAVPVGPAAAAKPFHLDYKVVKATSSSSASESSANWRGSATETWSLGRKQDGFPNTGYFDYSPATGGSGIAQLSLKGEYRQEAHTDLGDCAVDAPTGTDTFPGVAPSVFSLTFSQKKRGAVTVHFEHEIAALTNGYTPSECAHPDTVLPEEETLFTTRVSASVLKKKRFTIVNSGRPGGRYGDYAWKMSITLQRVKSHG